jgi:YidC/Oxa1 family membrane protein insertase
MNLDKNTVIGFVLLGLLFFAFFWYSNKSNEAYLAEQKHKNDSIAAVNALKVKPVDPVAARMDSLRRDSISKISAAGNFQTAAIGTEQIVSVENEVMKVAFTNKGGRIKYVDLKQYKDFDGKAVQLGNDTLAYMVNTASNNATSSNELFFSAADIVKNSDGSQSVKFSLKDATGETIEHEYIIKPNDYLIDWNINMNGADKLLSGSVLNLAWRSQLKQIERSSQYERLQSNICFSEGNSFDYISVKNQRKFEKPVQWLAMSRQFFNVALINKKSSFDNGNVNWQRSVDSSNVLGSADAALQMKVQSSASVNIPLQLYYGPNEYHILKNAAPEMDYIVNLGRDMYSFIRPINKFVIMPVFDFFASFVSNFGWVIMLLTIFIRLITAPLTYGSYVSGAKMKALRPELDVLKKKFGSDQQGYSMEQMKLFREVGVNPLGGCIPALVQIPIFVSLYSFFNSNIELRGKAFLWAHDLSQFDSIYHLPFSIPFGFGDHISLFSLTAVAASFLISIYNMQMTPTQDNPAMKYMPYIFPVMMLFFFNRLPAALTWYYTVSNTLTLILQFVIQRYIIDHDKILAKMQEARSKPKVKSKWQQRYDQMLESQKKIQDMKDKNNRK